MGAKGSVVNIPIDINDCLHVLLRSFDNFATIQLQLKRNLMHKSYYMHETIRPAAVCDSLKHLKETPLYRKNDIQIDTRYLERYEGQNFIVENDEAEANSKETNVNNELLSEHDESDEEVGEEVLLYDRNNICSDNVQIIAPGQNEKPVTWHMMENYDELCFPKIFAGHAFNLPKSLTYSDRVKSECRIAFLVDYCLWQNKRLNGNVHQT